MNMIHGIKNIKEHKGEKHMLKLNYIYSKDSNHKIIKLIDKTNNDEICSYYTEDVILDEIWLLAIKLCGAKIDKQELTQNEIDEYFAKKKGYSNEN